MSKIVGSLGTVAYIPQASFDAVTTLQGGVRWYRPEVDPYIRQRLGVTRAQSWPGIPDTYSLLFESAPYGSGWIYNAGELVSSAENDRIYPRYAFVSPEAVWPEGDGRLSIHTSPQLDRMQTMRGAYLMTQAMRQTQDVLKNWGWGLVGGSGGQKLADGSGGDPLAGGSKFFVFSIIAVLLVAAGMFVEASHKGA